MKFLSECFKINKLDLALLNETWFYKSDPQASKLLSDLKIDTGIDIIRKDRDSRGGRVAIAYNTNNMSLKKLNLTTLQQKKDTKYLYQKVESKIVTRKLLFFRVTCRLG